MWHRRTAYQLTIHSTTAQAISEFLVSDCHICHALSICCIFCSDIFKEEIILAQKSHNAQNSVPPLSNAVTSQVFFIVALADFCNKKLTHPITLRPKNSCVKMFSGQRRYCSVTEMPVNAMMLNFLVGLLISGSVVKLVNGFHARMWLVWHSVNCVGDVNKVQLCRARLLLGLVTWPLAGLPFRYFSRPLSLAIPLWVLDGWVQWVLEMVLATAGEETAISVYQWVLLPWLQEHWFIVR